MFAQISSGLDFQSKALVLRAERQRIVASNIANADTPGYAARDFDFKSALQEATGTGTSLSMPASRDEGARSVTHPGHIPLNASSSGKSALAYTIQSQPSMDGNSVDLDRERANFADNAVRYEATLRFINGQSKTMLSAIQGQ